VEPNYCTAILTAVLFIPRKLAEEFDDATADECRDMHNFDVDACVVCAWLCLR
jgi:hypothetical protein